MPYVKVRGFAPDAEPNTLGILVECDGLVPTLRGMRGLPGDSDVGYSSMSQSVRAASTLQDLDGTSRIFAYGTNKVYEAASNLWVDRTKSGGTYSTSTSARPSFAQYGDVSYMAQLSIPIQASSAGAFDDLTNAPNAKIVLVALDFVMALSTSTNSDGWQCSAAGDPSSWTADVATQASAGRLYDSPGPITAGGVLQSNVVAFKERSMFLGQYVGPPIVWSWRQIPGGGLGAPGPLSVVDIETALLFPGYDNFYLFDGARPVPIATNRVANYYFEDLNYEFQYAVQGYHDRTNWRVYWWYPSIAQSNSTLDKFLVYNYRSDMWGAGTKTVQAVFEWVSPGLSYDNLGTSYSTWDDLPNATYNAAFAAFSTPLMGIFDTQRRPNSMSGASGTTECKTNDHGEDNVISLVDRVRPRFATTPTTAELLYMGGDDLGATFPYQGNFRELVGGAFDEVHAERWHRFCHRYNGDVELLGWDISIKPDSLE